MTMNFIILIILIVRNPAKYDKITINLNLIIKFIVGYTRTFRKYLGITN